MKGRGFSAGVVTITVLAVAAAMWYTLAVRRAKPINVVLISIDTLRADHLGCYGYEFETTPNIDKLAKEATVFTNALSQSPWTLPSHMSIMTSLYPSIHGVGPTRHALSPSIPTLAEILSGNGYETAAFVSWVYVGHQWGFAKGFDRFDELWGPPRTADNPAGGSFPAGVVTEAAIRWVQGAHPKPFFLFVHYFDPHMNYEPPPPYDTMFDPGYEGPATGEWSWIKPYIKWLNKEPETIDQRDRRHVVALYDGEIRNVDENVKRLLDALDQNTGLDNCLVVLTSDHGEEFNDHGSMEGHGWTLYQEVLHVPLIVRHPGHRPGPAVIDSTVALIDIAPTVLDIVGAQAPKDFQGASLKDMLRGRGGAEEERYLFSETYRYNRKRSVRGLRYKLIHTEDSGVGQGGVRWEEGWELFDLLRDPKELHNLYDESSPVVKVLAERLERFKELRSDAWDRGEPANVSKEDLELLRSLGYVE